MLIHCVWNTDLQYEEAEKETVAGFVISKCNTRNVYYTIK